MKETFLAVAGRIRQELQEIGKVVERAVRIWERAATSSDDYYVDAAALNLHGFYAGLEHLFEVIADSIDHAKPSGPRWHQDLLRQMASEIPGVRPPVIRPETRDRLDQFRGFRHVVRNVYTFNLDPAQIEILVQRLRPTMDEVAKDLLDFATFLEQIGAESEDTV